MRAVIYAGYSSDLQREASIDDQIQLCKERIKAVLPVGPPSLARTATSPSGWSQMDAAPNVFACFARGRGNLPKRAERSGSLRSRWPRAEGDQGWALVGGGAAAVSAFAAALMLQSVRMSSRSTSLRSRHMQRCGIGFVPQLSRQQEHALMDAAQLPKTGRSSLAQSVNSLFDFAEKRPISRRLFLADQFRSAPGIVDYINQEFYAGRLCRAERS